MASAYTGTMTELRKLSDDEKLDSFLSERYEKYFTRPSASLVSSWRNSVPIVLEALSDRAFDQVPVLIETRMPIGDERADIILLGGNATDRKAMVVELKQWSRVSQTSSDLLVDVPVEGSCEHPSAQVLNYMGKLRMLHSLGSTFTWKACALLHNLSPAYGGVLETSVTKPLVERAPVFYKDDLKGFATFCSEFLLPSEVTSSLASEFDQAPFEQTTSFFEIIRENAKAIAGNVTEAVAESGTGLTEEQLRVVEEVIESTENREERVFLVEGAPGSGKSLVAVYMLLRSIEKDRGAVLALRNNRLMTVLRACFDKAYRGASGATVYYSVPRSQRGIGDRGFEGSFDLIVGDEAQRLGDANIPLILGRAPTVTFLFDETQILNPPENGTRENFERHAAASGKEVIYHRLSSFMRCRGGSEYHNWVEDLLQGSPSGTPVAAWRDKYQFEIVQDISSMLERLKAVRDSARVALVASFTESPGKMGSPNHPDNIRVGYPLTSGFDMYRGLGLIIPWLMDPKADYKPFWLEGGSNNLDSIASIYGCQGFESDFVGIIWGRDFVWRNGAWVIGNRDCITDNIDGLKGCIARDPELALNLLRNRYRIFLTRGMLGTFIFCEDEETSIRLLSLVREGQ